MDNDFDLERLGKLLEEMLLFSLSLLQDKRFDEDTYTYIFGNINNYSKFDKKLKKSINKLKKHDKKIRVKNSKEDNKKFTSDYISDRVNVCTLLEELMSDLERINQNKARELVRRQ